MVIGCVNFLNSTKEHLNCFLCFNSWGNLGHGKPRMRIFSGLKAISTTGPCSKHVHSTKKIINAFTVWGWHTNSFLKYFAHEHAANDYCKFKYSNGSSRVKVLLNMDENLLLLRQTADKLIAVSRRFFFSGLWSAFKFGRRVHFALRRKMLKPPIARLPAI